MSRIGKNPIPIPDKVNVTLDGLDVTVKGPKGELKRTLPTGVSVNQVDNSIVVSPTSTKRTSRERHGLCRALVAMVIFLLPALCLIQPQHSNPHALPLAPPSPSPLGAPPSPSSTMPPPLPRAPPAETQVIYKAILQHCTLRIDIVNRRVHYMMFRISFR